MKKILVLVFWILGGIFHLSAQQLPHFMLQEPTFLWHNPAYAGVKEGVILLSRQQWTGVSQYPSTFVIGMDKQEGKNAIGGVLAYDRTGAFQSVYWQVPYNFKITFSEKYFLKLGLAPMFQYRNVLLSTLHFPNQFSPDSGWNPQKTPTISQTNEDNLYFRLNIGFWLQLNGFYFGMSAFSKPLFAFKEDKTLKYDDERYKPFMTFIHIGYKFTAIKKYISLIPFVRYIPSDLSSNTYGSIFDIGCNFLLFDERLQVGGLYRSPDINKHDNVFLFSINAGVRATKRFRVLASYDFYRIESINTWGPSFDVGIQYEWKK